MGAKQEKDVMPDGSVEVTLKELEDFLEADRLQVRARPEFKERLREKLWDLVRDRGRRWRGDRP